MCKYCKNLKRIKDLDEQEYLDIIQKWRQRDKIARGLLTWLKMEVLEPSDSVLQDVLIRQVDDFLKVDWIGK